MTDKPRIRVAARTRAVDTFQNLEARLGIGADNLLSATTYNPTYLSRIPRKLEFMYRGSWIVGQAVDVVAEDMTRAGIEYRAELPPEDIEALQSAERRLRIWPQLCETIKWSRLYGGALAVMMIDGQDLATPLRVETIGRGQFRGLHVLDRWMVQPSINRLVTDLGEDYGKPEFYTVLADGSGFANQPIHYSRVMRIDGIELPFWQRLTENGWGESVVERLYDRMVAYDSASLGAAQLTGRAYLQTLKIDGYREVVAAGGKAFTALVEQIDNIRRFRSQEGLTVIDATDEIEAASYAFTGLSDVLLQFGQQISGAMNIPLVRLFGQSPAGLNSTGDSDWENYYNFIIQQQEMRLRSPLTRLLAVMHVSELGRPPEDNFGFAFEPLWQMQEAEKADCAQKVTATVLAAHDAGVVSAQTVLRELRQTCRGFGLWTNITDEDIDAADEEPPSANEMLAPVPGEEPPAPEDDPVDTDDSLKAEALIEQKLFEPNPDVPQAYPEHVIRQQTVLFPGGVYME